MSRLLALDLAPGRRRRTATRALALAPAERVIHRVHRHATDLGPLAQPAALPGLAHRKELVLRVAHLTHRGQTPAVDQPHLRGAEPESDVFALLGYHLRAGTGGAGELATLP